MFVCVRVDVWETVIRCMGVDVKDRIRIMIILVPSI